MEDIDSILFFRNLVGFLPFRCLRTDFTNSSIPLFLAAGLMATQCKASKEVKPKSPSFPWGNEI